MTRGTQPGLRFRTRKLSPKQLLPVLCEDQIETSEYKELLENQYKVETGVEKSEENEYHLQEALAAALSRGGKDAKKIVPAPPAEESNGIDYDKLYALEFPNPSTYIRFSQTVEECTGCQYNMTTEDDTYLQSYNEKIAPSAPCSEDDFERIMEVFESTADRQAPFAAIDNTVVAYDVMEFTLKQEVNEKLITFAKDIYEHWKTRRQCSSNRPLQSSLKSETHQDNDDGDPYVCFRRRDVRQTRKTRARDIQSTEKLRRLRKELEEGRQLASMAHQREVAKLDLITVDRMIFEQRAKVKDIRLRLGIKVDDEDLIQQKIQKKKPQDNSLLRLQGTHLRLPVGSAGRPIDADLTLLSDILVQKENMLQMEVDQKVQQHQRWNQNHIDVTRDPLSPVRGQGIRSGFRHAATQYLMTPPASVSSDSSDDRSPAPEKEVDFFRFPPRPDQVDSHRQPAYRRRIGRLGRLWIDRRGLPTPLVAINDRTVDRWKYDQDDDDDTLIYEVDPYDTRAIKFRATIPYAPTLHSRRSQQEQIAIGGQGLNKNSGSPLGRPPSTTQTHPTPT